MIMTGRGRKRTGPNKKMKTKKDEVLEEASLGLGRSLRKKKERQKRRLTRVNRSMNL
jgi:hypothetical protein